MYKYSELRSLHLEITSLCNANCPMCPRTLNGGKINPNLYLKELSLENIKSFFSEEFVKQLGDIFFCGNYGDPIVAKDFMKIIEYFRSCNEKIYLHMHTNGSLHDKNWWQKMAELLKENTGSVTFAVDGLRDTNAIYRQNTDFDKIMDNAKAFIESGGEARWNYFVFKHNEHQVEEARALAKEMGFTRFSAKKTERFHDMVKGELIEKFEVKNRAGEVVSYLEPPTSNEFRNELLDFVPQVIKEHGSFFNFLEKAPIVCRELESRRVFVSAQGQVFPCGFINHALYDDYAVADSVDEEIKAIVDFDDVDLFKNSLEDILSSESFRRIEESWSKKKHAEGRLKVCSLTCGRFDRIQSQSDSGFGFGMEE